MIPDLAELSTEVDSNLNTSLRSRNQRICLWTAPLLNAANVLPISDGAPDSPGALSGRLLVTGLIG